MDTNRPIVSGSLWLWRSIFVFCLMVPDLASTLSISSNQSVAGLSQEDFCAPEFDTLYGYGNTSNLADHNGSPNSLFKYVFGLWAKVLAYSCELFQTCFGMNLSLTINTAIGCWRLLKWMSNSRPFHRTRTPSDLSSGAAALLHQPLYHQLDCMEPL